MLGNHVEHLSGLIVSFLAHQKSWTLWKEKADQSSQYSQANCWYLNVIPKFGDLIEIEANTEITNCFEHKHAGPNYDLLISRLKFKKVTKPHILFASDGPTH